MCTCDERVCGHWGCSGKGLSHVFHFLCHGRVGKPIHPREPLPELRHLHPTANGDKESVSACCEDALTSGSWVAGRRGGLSGRVVDLDPPLEASEVCCSKDNEDKVSLDVNLAPSLFLNLRHSGVISAQAAGAVSEGPGGLEVSIKQGRDAVNGERKQAFLPLSASSSLLLQSLLC